MNRRAAVPLVVAVAVAVATFVAYLPAVDGEFVLDDSTLVSDPLISAPLDHGIREWLRTSRPLATATFALNRAWFGFETRGWHLTNIAVHLVVVLLVWGLARVTFARAGLDRPEGPSAVVAAFYALHPIQSAAVAYVAQRSEILASGLLVAALLLLLARDAATRSPRRGLLLGGAIAVHVLALLAKPIAATLPAVWLLHAAVLPAPGEEDVPLARRLRARAVAALLLLAVSAAFAWRSVAAVAGELHAGFDIPNLPASAYAATQLRVVPTYLRLVFWPSGQSGDWYFRASRSFLEPEVLAGAAFLVVLAAGAVATVMRTAKRQGDGAAAARIVGFGVLFFLVVLTPSSSVVPLRDLLAEHRLYLAVVGPIAGVVAVVSVGLGRAAPRWAAVVGAVSAVAVLAGAGLLTARRASVWSSAYAFWSDAAAKGGEKARVHANLANALYYLRLPDAARAELAHAVRLAGDGSASRDVLVANAVTMLLSMERPEDARATATAELAARPGDGPTLLMLAQIECAERPGERCEGAARSALAAPPRRSSIPVRALALKYQGISRLRQRDVPAALVLLRQAAAEPGADAEIPAWLGVAEELGGNPAAACAAYAHAAGMPGNPDASRRALRDMARLGCR